MVTKLILLTLLTSCGVDVKLKENKLESVTPLTSKQLETIQKTGTFTKGTVNQITYQNKTYKVSAYSSHDAINFMNSIPQGVSVAVIFTGGLSTTEVVLESIKRQ